MAALCASPKPLVSVHSHAAQWVEANGQSVFRFEATARNTLDIPLTGIDIGVVYASDESALESIEPSDLYRDEAAIKIGVSTIALRLFIPQSIPAKSSARIQWEIPSSQALRASAVKPRAFVSHLLGYRFATNPLTLMDTLVQTDSAADEWAVMESLGLVPSGRSLFDARESWKQMRGRLDTLTQLFKTDLPVAPKQAIVSQWVIRVLALGVMGGDRALAVLSDLEKRRDLTHLDEGFQILRLARLTKSIYESPLAFSFPTPTANIRDLLVYAKGLSAQEFKEVPDEMVPEVGQANLGLLEKSSSNSSLNGVGVGLLIGFCLGVMGILLWSSRQNSRKGQNEQ